MTLSWEEDSEKDDDGYPSSDPFVEVTVVVTAWGKEGELEKEDSNGAGEEESRSPERVGDEDDEEDGEEEEVVSIITGLEDDNNAGQEEDVVDDNSCEIFNVTAGLFEFVVWICCCISDEE